MSLNKTKNESAYGKARLVRTLRGLELGLASLALSECSFSRLLFLRCLIFSLRGSMQSLRSHPFCCTYISFVQPICKLDIYNAFALNPALIHGEIGYIPSSEKMI